MKKNFINPKIIFPIVIIFFISVNNIYNNNKLNHIEKIDNNEIENIEDSNIVEEDESIFVDVKGAVLNPGLYEVDNDTRVGDVIKLAGGLTHANSQCVNLSKKLNDEEVIFIPDKSQMCESGDGLSQKNIESSEENGIKEEKDTNLININTSTLDELTTLPGIGESKAANIITYRETIGSFASKEELVEVNGIGQTTYEQLKDEITI